MTAKKTRFEIDEEQALYFRARRSHLAGSGAPNLAAAARAILGGQAQSAGPGMLALSVRTRGRPTAAAVGAAMAEKPRSLVRTWGQRGTVHIYDPADWRLIVAARKHWVPRGHREPMPTQKTLDQLLQLVEKSGTATRTDLIGVASPSYERAIAEVAHRYVTDEGAVKRFVAGRLFWRLALRGDVCMAVKVRQEQAYAARSSWFPELDWPELVPEEAAVELTRRYLSFAAPATTRDVAHFFGARMREAKDGMSALENNDELIAVRCGPREGLRALARDANELRRRAPATLSSWPVRLLPQWDTHLMGHADKSWTCPDEDDRKQVWRKSAVVAAAVLARGRVVAEWTRQVAGDRLRVTVLPLSRWKTSRHLPSVKREARDVAAHLGLGGAEVRTEAVAP